MGLDMWLYRAKRLTNKEMSEVCGKEIYSRADIYYLDPEEENDYESLLPFLQKAKVFVKYIDTAKIKKDNSVPENAKIFSRSLNGDTIKICFIWDEEEDKVGDGVYYDEDEDENEDEESKTESKTITLSNEEINEKYTITKTEDRYVVKLKEVYYWRKNYDLQKKLCALSDELIVNCGYHALNDEMLEAIKEDTGRHFSNKTKNLFYHEWY